jgi:NADPH2:quinone reductase
MQAIIMTGVGGPDVLQLADIPTPAPGPNQLLVRVRAAGVNPIDCKVRKSGAFGAGHGTVLGHDAAGVVEAIGPGVSSFKPGDRVFYSPDWSIPGSYAQYHLVSSDLPVVMPGNLSFEQAAAIPLAGITAYDALFTRAGLALGDTVLVSAANGGVGSIAVQLARAAGAFVIATCSTRSESFVRAIPTASGAGPDLLLNYQTQNWSDQIRAQFPQGLDLAFDFVGQDVVSRAIPLLRPHGTIVTIVNPAGKFDEGYRKNINLHYYFLQRRAATLQKLRTLLERRQLAPLIDSILPLKDAAEAHRRIEAGGVCGKIILQIP